MQLLSVVMCYQIVIELFEQFLVSCWQQFLVLLRCNSAAGFVLVATLLVLVWAALCVWIVVSLNTHTTVMNVFFFFKQEQEETE